MIAGLSGVVAEKLEKSAVLDVNGVKYEVQMSLTDLTHLPMEGQSVELWTRLIPSDDALTMYGFTSREAQRLFDLLLTVTGVGPRLALNILGSGSIADIVTSISRDEPERFLKVARLGRKTAQRIILELKTKVVDAFPASAKNTTATHHSIGTDLALQALVELGYSSGQAKEALATIDAEDPSTRLKEALKNLSKAALSH
jgi:Holliday junction DNA helicase RuvA